MIKKFSISEDLGMRLDKLLKERFPDHSRSYFQYLIDEHHVLINSLPVKKQYRPVVGDSVEISFHPSVEIDVKPENIPLDILYEDSDLIVVNKPAGMVVHPAPGAYSKTFANALLYHCKELKVEEFDPMRPGIVHRLDKETSGVLIAAKTQRAHQGLTTLFSSREVEKHYLAICYGVPKEGECHAPIKRHPIKRKEMTVSHEGKEAITHFKTLHRRDGLSLVEAILITGRTHQIRVHLRSLNCPIIGDSTYGSHSLNQKYKAERQMLHAHSIKFLHPLTNLSIEIQAPIPQDMKNFIEFIQQPALK